MFAALSIHDWFVLDFIIIQIFRVSFDIIWFRHQDRQKERHMSRFKEEDDKPVQIHILYIQQFLNYVQLLHWTRCDGFFLLFFLSSTLTVLGFGFERKLTIWRMKTFDYRTIMVEETKSSWKYRREAYERKSKVKFVC